MSDKDWNLIIAAVMETYCVSRARALKIIGKRP